MILMRTLRLLSTGVARLARVTPAHNWSKRRGRLMVTLTIGRSYPGVENSPLPDHIDIARTKALRNNNTDTVLVPPCTSTSAFRNANSTP